MQHYRFHRLPVIQDKVTGKLVSATDKGVIIPNPASRPAKSASPWIGYTILLGYIASSFAAILSATGALRGNSAQWAAEWGVYIVLSVVASIIIVLIGKRLESSRRIVPETAENSPIGSMSLFLIAIGVVSALLIFVAHEIFDLIIKTPEIITKTATEPSKIIYEDRNLVRETFFLLVNKSEPIKIAIYILTCTAISLVTMGIAWLIGRNVSDDNFTISKILKRISAHDPGTIEGPDTQSEQDRINADILAKQNDLQTIQNGRLKYNEYDKNRIAYTQAHEYEKAQIIEHNGLLAHLPDNRSSELTAVIQAVSTSLSASVKALESIIGTLNKSISDLFSEINAGVAKTNGHIVLNLTEGVEAFRRAETQLESEIVKLHWELEDAKRRDKLPLKPVMHAQETIPFDGSLIDLDYAKSNGRYILHQEVKDQNHYGALTIATIAFLTLNNYLISPELPVGLKIGAFEDIWPCLLFSFALMAVQGTFLFILLRDYARSIKNSVTIEGVQGALRGIGQAIAYFAILATVIIVAFLLKPRTVTPPPPNEPLPVAILEPVPLNCPWVYASKTSVEGQISDCSLNLNLKAKTYNYIVIVGSASQEGLPLEREQNRAKERARALAAKLMAENKDTSIPIFIVNLGKAKIDVTLKSLHETRNQRQVWIYAGNEPGKTPKAWSDVAATVNSRIDMDTKRLDTFDEDQCEVATYIPGGANGLENLVYVKPCKR